MDTENLIYGRNPVEEQFHHYPDRVVKLFIRENLRGAKVDQLLKAAKEHRIPVQRVPGKKLYEMVGKVNDQGMVAQVSPVTFVELQDWLESIDLTTHPAVLILDEIEDTHNFGAIIRSAAASGIDGIIIGKHRQAPVNASVIKTAAGTAQHVPMIRVTNLNQSIIELKEAGFWIMGLDQNGDQSYWKADYNLPLGMVLGNENKGIRQKTLEHCDFKIFIPMPGPTESLNVSVSSALLCYERLRQKSTG